MKITPLPTTDEVLDYGTYKVADVQDIKEKVVKPLYNKK